MKLDLMFRGFGLFGQLSLEYLNEKFKPDSTEQQTNAEVDDSGKQVQKTQKNIKLRKRNPESD